MSAHFTFSLREPATSEFLDVRASVSCRGYAGETTFSVARRDLAAFIAEADALREARTTVAQLIGGWDTASERLRLGVRPAGTSGQFHARINVAATGPRTDSWQRVETDFVCSPAQMSDFLRALSDLLTGVTSDAVLVGDAAAIA